jgi:hypothetical protein
MKIDVKKIFWGLAKDTILPSVMFFEYFDSGVKIECV